MSPSAPRSPLSAQRLHELALEAFRTGNRGRLSLCEVLRVLGETRLYFDLGFPSLPAYAGAFFQLRRAQAYEYVRVASALAALPELREAFNRARIGWSALRAITRVATPATQAEWIEFARRHRIERTLAEAQDALRRGGNAPRKGSYGLPNLSQKMIQRFSRSEMARVRSWIESACLVIAERTGVEGVSLEQAVLFLCETAGFAGRSDQLVYQRCPDCRRSRVATDDGLVEVAAAEIERREGCAEAVVIDGPTPPALRRRILGREASRCGNPRCHHRADHCHHIAFRSHGGRTELENQVAVCTTCHALIHAGLLQVTAQADGELCWLPVVGEPRFESALADASVARHESTIGDSVHNPPVTIDVHALACGLTRLGWSAALARRAIEVALDALPPGERTESKVLHRALASLAGSGGGARSRAEGNPT